MLHLADTLQFSATIVVSGEVMCFGLSTAFVSDSNHSPHNSQAATISGFMKQQRSNFDIAEIQKQVPLRALPRVLEPCNVHMCMHPRSYNSTVTAAQACMVTVRACTPTAAAPRFKC